MKQEEKENSTSVGDEDALRNAILNRRQGSQASVLNSILSKYTDSETKMEDYNISEEDFLRTQANLGSTSRSGGSKSHRKEQRKEVKSRNKLKDQQIFLVIMIIFHFSFDHSL